MAKPTLVNAKTQAAAIAVALNAGLHDTVLTGIIPEWKRPDHPMRKTQNWVKMDKAGTYVADDDYLDAAYVGKVHVTGYVDKDDKVTEAPA